MNFDNDSRTSSPLFVTPEEKQRSRKIFIAVISALGAAIVLIYVWINFIIPLIPTIIGKWEVMSISDMSDEEFAENVERNGGGQEMEFFNDGTGVMVGHNRALVDWEIALERFAAEMERQGIYDIEQYDWELFGMEYFYDDSGAVETQVNDFTWKIRRGKLYIFAEHGNDDMAFDYQLSLRQLIIAWEAEYIGEGESASITLNRIIK